ncbi:MAG: hypothetical protein BMS9Abin05_0735 [Rhodothermia bacterium]|nr:MAG: hypothetical protein BMS9Abin05_0735 [Rhodothermia bacterium]
MIRRLQIGALALVFTIVVSGCELYSNTGDDRVVEGVSFTELFRPPGASEIQTIENEWAGRSTEAVDVQIVEQFRLATSTLSIVSHQVVDITHYGAIIAPDGGAIGTLPVIVYAHGGDGGVSIDEEVLLVLSFLGDVRNQFVVVVPSFRSESIRYQSRTWLSDGPPSPWDYDVDDALSLLSATPTVAPAADLARVGVVGLSRGAGVGLLMGIRDPRVSVVVDFFGPTDFFGPFVQDVVEEALLGSLRDLPGLDFLDEQFIQPIKRGEMTEAEVRPELIRRSPVFFVDRIPDLQIHHGNLDMIVPVSQGKSLEAAMLAAGRGSSDFESYFYELGQHNPITLVGSLDRTVDFLSRLLEN